MKKILCLLMTFGLFFALCACGDKTGTDEKVPENTSQGTETSTTKKESINIDLTLMSGTMVYSQVYDMVNYPQKYVGQTVKMRGTFSASYWEETETYYPALLIADTAACCSQGMEFLLKDEPTYPTGYPEKGEEVTVVGLFETYTEGSQTYCRLVDSRTL